MTRDVLGHMIVYKYITRVIHFAAFLLCFALLVAFKFLAVVILKT